MNLKHFQDAVKKLADGRTHTSQVEKWYYAVSGRTETLFRGAVFSREEPREIFSGWGETPEDTIANLAKALAEGNEL